MLVHLGVARDSGSRGRVIYAHEGHVRLVAVTVRVARRAVVGERARSRIEAAAVGNQVGVGVAVRLLVPVRAVRTNALSVPVGPGMRLKPGRGVAGSSGGGMLVFERTSQLGRHGAQARLREAILGQAHATSCGELAQPRSVTAAPDEEAEGKKQASARWSHGGWARRSARRSPHRSRSEELTLKLNRLNTGVGSH